MRPQGTTLLKTRKAREFAGDFIIGLAVFLAVFALAALDTRAARSAPALASKTAPSIHAAPLSPAGVATGTLFLSIPAGDNEHATPRNTNAATHLDTNVDITVTGPIARATVTQRFRNTGSRWVEGIYAFPLPETAAVDALSMRIGERVVKGEITPRGKALQIYEAANRAGRKPTPLSQDRPNVFTSAIANIGPGEEITIRIEYQEMLRRNGESYSLRFPLVVAPRYDSKPPVRPVRLGGHAGVSGPNPPVIDPADGKINPVSLQVRLNSGFPLGEVRSETHEIALRRTGEETALVALTQGHVPADRDFELTWRTVEAALPLATAFTQEINGNSYVLAMLAPPRIEASPAPSSREAVFVIDTSGSMAGTSIEQVKEGLALALERLRPGDRFNLIRFDSRTEKLFDEPNAVTPQSLAIARAFVSGLDARGGTEILPALKAALADPRKDNAKRMRQVVFLTDGAVSNEAELLSFLASERGRTRLFMVGIGSAPNSFLMRRAAEIGRGSFIHVTTRSQVLERMNRLFARLERPVITDLKAEWAPGLRADVWPDPLSDLYAGEPIALTARLSALKGELKITGRIAGKPWSRTLALAGAKKGNGIGKFWARRKIVSLEARRYAGQSASDVDAAIEAVAMEHGLVSRMTSIVAVDATPSRPEDQPLASEDLPVNLPAGWVYDKVFGTGPAKPAARTIGTRSAALSRAAPPRAHQQDASAPLTDPLRAHGVVKAIPDGKPQLAFKSGNPAGVPATAPGTREPSRGWTLTIMALVFAFMSALTLGLWRHLRHSVEPTQRGRRG